MNRRLRRIAAAVAMAMALGGTALAQGYWQYPSDNRPPPTYNVTPNGNGWMIQQNPNPGMLVPHYVVPVQPPQPLGQLCNGAPCTYPAPMAPPPIFLR